MEPRHFLNKLAEKVEEAGRARSWAPSPEPCPWAVTGPDANTPRRLGLLVQGLSCLSAGDFAASNAYSLLRCVCETEGKRERKRAGLILWRHWDSQTLN